MLVFSRVQLFHLIPLQLPPKDPRILLNPLFVHALRERNTPHLQAPSEQDLGGGPPVLFGELVKVLAACRDRGCRILRRGGPGEPLSTHEGRVSLDGDVVGLAVGEGVATRAPGVDLRYGVAIVKT